MYFSRESTESFKFCQKKCNLALNGIIFHPPEDFPKKIALHFFPCPFRTKKAGVAENWYMTSNLGSRTNQGGEIRDPPTPFFDAKKFCCWGKTWRKKSANGLWKSAQGFLFRLYSCTSYLMNLWTTTRTWLSWCPDVIWCCIAWICLSTKAIFKIKRLWLKTKSPTNHKFCSSFPVLHHFFPKNSFFKGTKRQKPWTHQANCAASLCFQVSIEESGDSASGLSLHLGRPGLWAIGWCGRQKPGENTCLCMLFPGDFGVQSHMVRVFKTSMLWSTRMGHTSEPKVAGWNSWTNSPEMNK